MCEIQLFDSWIFDSSRKLKMSYLSGKFNSGFFYSTLENPYNLQNPLRYYETVPEVTIIFQVADSNGLIFYSLISKL